MRVFATKAVELLQVLSEKKRNFYLNFCFFDYISILHICDFRLCNYIPECALRDVTTIHTAIKRKF